jgi:hypothetical protein
MKFDRMEYKISTYSAIDKIIGDPIRAALFFTANSLTPAAGVWLWARGEVWGLLFAVVAALLGWGWAAHTARLQRMRDWAWEMEMENELKLETE